MVCIHFKLHPAREHTLQCCHPPPVSTCGTTLLSALPSQTLRSLDEGPLDLFGWRYRGSTGDNTIRGIIRRDQNINNNGSAAVLDFNSAEAFTAVSASASVSGGTPSLTVRTGSGCGYGAFMGNALTFNGTIYGVPASVQRPTDRHVFGATLSTSNGFRAAAHFFRAMTNQSVTLPSALPTPAVTTLTGPYRRLQVSFALPTEYAVASYFYTDGRNTVTLHGNAGYFGGNNRTMSTPDLSGVAGYSANWFTTTTGQVGTTFRADSSANNACEDGSTYLSAAVFSNN